MGALNTIRTSIAGPSLITVSLKTDAAILGKYSEIIIIIIIRGNIYAVKSKDQNIL